MTKRSFIFYPDWLDFIDRIGNEKDKLDLYQIIVSYGCHGEYSTENSMMSAVFESLIKPKIDVAQDNYLQSISNGKNFGRKKIVDDEVVSELAKSGMKAKEIAAQLGISEAAIYHSEGWKRRNL